MKKFLIPILVFVMSLFLSIAAAASNEAGSYEAAGSLLSQLSINSSITKTETEAVTREEFAAMAVRAMNVPLSGTDGLPFTDCAESSFLAEIATAKKYGLTNGTSATTFSPDEKVSTVVAARILVAALGYTDKAEALGGYPYGYLNVANSLDIFKGTQITEEFVTLGESYQLIYNTLLADVNILYGIEDGQIISGGVEGKNLLTENFGFEHISGVVTTVGGYSAGLSYDYDGSIVIGDKTLKNGDLYTEYFAMDVDAWYNPDTKELGALIATEANKLVDINPKDTVYNSYELNSFDENNREKSYTLEKDFTFILNGRPAVHTNDSFTFEHGSLKLIDNNGNGRYDFVIARKTEYFVVRGLNMVDSVAYDKYSPSGSVALVSENGSYVSLEKNGKETTVYNIKTDNVLEVYKSANSKVCYVYVSSTVVSGKLTEVGDSVIAIDGKFYEVNSYFKDKNPELTMGAAYTFLIASDGTVTDISYPSDTGMNYGFLLGFGSQPSAFSKPQIKLLDENDNIMVYDIADKIKLDGDSMSYSNTKLEEKLANYQLIRFRLTDGKVSAVDTFTDASDWNIEERKDESDSLTRYMKNHKIFYRSNVNFGIPGVAFSNAVVFTVPADLAENPGGDYDDDMFFVNPSATLINDTDRIVDVYDYDENFLPGAVVVYFSTKNTLASPSEDIASGIVREVTDSADDEGNPAKLLKLYVDGLYKQYFIDETIYGILQSENKVPGSGDVVRATVDRNDKVTALSIDVDYNSETGKLSVNYGVDKVGSYPYSYITYFSGNVVSRASGLMSIKADSAPAGSEISDGIVNLCVGSPQYILYSRKTGEAKACDESYIVSGGLSSPESGTYVLCKSRYYGVNTVYVYTD